MESIVHSPFLYAAILAALVLAVASVTEMLARPRRSRSEPSIRIHPQRAVRSVIATPDRLTLHSNLAAAYEAAFNRRHAGKQRENLRLVLLEIADDYVDYCEGFGCVPSQEDFEEFVCEALDRYAQDARPSRNTVLRAR